MAVISPPPLTKKDTLNLSKTNQANDVCVHGSPSFTPNAVCIRNAAQPNGAGLRINNPTSNRMSLTAPQCTLETHLCCAPTVCITITVITHSMYPTCTGMELIGRFITSIGENFGLEVHHLAGDHAALLKSKNIRIHGSCPARFIAPHVCT